MNRVDWNKVIDKIDLDQQLSRIDMDTLIDRIDFEKIVEKSNIEGIVARSSSGIFLQFVDIIRIRIVILDLFVQRLARGTCSRKHEKPSWTFFLKKNTAGWP